MKETKCSHAVQPASLRLALPQGRSGSTRAGPRHRWVRLCKSHVWVPGSLSVSLSSVCSGRDNVMCWDHSGRATAFPNSAVQKKKKNELVGSPTTSCGVLVNDAEVHISGVFRKDLLQKHEQQRRRLPGTLRVVASSSQNRAMQPLSDVLVHLPADTRTHRMDDRCQERSNSCQVLAWSRRQKSLRSTFAKALRADMAHVWRVQHTPIWVLF